MLRADQIRAARALLDWSQSQLAERAALSLPTIKRMEGASGPGRSSADNVEKIRAALEQSGIIFIPVGGSSAEGGAGVRLKS
jgi:transcriptional regulator with XRE-family HTH domain